MDFTEERDSEWQCTSPQTDNHAFTNSSSDKFLCRKDTLPVVQPNLSAEWENQAD